MTKQEYRETYKKLRDRFASPEDGAAAMRRLRESAAYRNAGMVMTYLSFGSEVGTVSFARAVLADGKRLCVPVCRTNPISMQAAEVVDLDAELAPGRFGILEPVAVRPVDPGLIGLVVTPGVAFDRAGYRIGYGKGFYDRFLPQLSPNAVKIGVCYGFSLVDSLPHDGYDVPVDWVMTEREEIEIEKAAF